MGDIKSLLLAKKFGSGTGGSGGDTSKEDAIITKSLSGHYVNNRVEFVRSSVFESNNKLISVSMENAKSIGLKAFDSCELLESIDFPSAITIDDQCFYNCVSLVNVSLPKLERIGYNAFGNCDVLKELRFPSLKRINPYAFQYCPGLEKIDCGNCTEIYPYAFQYCTSLKAIILRTTETVCNASLAGLETTPLASGEMFIYIPSSMWDAYEATFGDMSGVRKIEDYPEICG